MPRLGHPFPCPFGPSRPSLSLGPSRPSPAFFLDPFLDPSLAPLAPPGHPPSRKEQRAGRRATPTPRMRSIHLTESYDRGARESEPRREAEGRRPEGAAPQACIKRLTHVGQKDDREDDTGAQCRIGKKGLRSYYLDHLFPQ